MPASSSPSPPPSRPPSRQTSAHITLRNLIATRWVLVTLVSAASLLGLAMGGSSGLSAWLPATEHPVAAFCVLGAWIGHNLFGSWQLRHGSVREIHSGLHLLIDASALTLLLGLAGGASNPFTILYFLPITLATQVSPRWTWALALWSLACFASLFVLAPAVQEGAGAMPMHMMGEGHFVGHLRGMWVAFGLTGVLMTVFIHRIALGISRQRAELVRLRQAALEDRHLAAIGTLAAGAAHELGTPLGTMTLLTDELALMDTDEREDALVTIREQLGRCKLIVSRMASPELRVDSLGVVPRAWPLRELAQVLRELTPGEPLRVRLDPSAEDRLARQPFEALAQLMRELVTNAAEACRRKQDPSADVEVELSLGRGETLEMWVRDRGVGMGPELLDAAFDPFLSTRPEGAGLGMGLYLARAHLRQLGGSIEIESVLGEGTNVHVRLPLSSRVQTSEMATT